MKTLLGWFSLRLGCLGVLLAGVIGHGVVHAQTYNIQLKNPTGTAVNTCATGGFTFNKTTTGTFAIPSASVTLNGTCDFPLTNGHQNGAYAPGGPNPLSVVVENVTISGQAQGPNVVGLSGTLVRTTNAVGDCNGVGTATNTKTWTMTFSYASNSQNAAGRTFTLACTGDGTRTTVVRRYHAFNTNTVPEPGMFWLAVTALGALFAAQRWRRR
jgi:hypothetical protein